MYGCNHYLNAIAKRVLDQTGATMYGFPLSRE
jgi:hypothetical protein